jgi:uncharacterized protein (TIGR00645 family)
MAATFSTLPVVLSMHERDLVLLILSLIDLALLGSLTLMVAFAGYENFVSKMHTVTGHEDRPEWMGHIDFSGLKLKLISSIVAISAIHLLRTFSKRRGYPERRCRLATCHSSRICRFWSAARADGSR